MFHFLCISSLYLFTCRQSHYFSFSSQYDLWYFHFNPFWCDCSHPFSFTHTLSFFFLLTFVHLPHLSSIPPCSQSITTQYFFLSIFLSLSLSFFLLFQLNRKFNLALFFVLIVFSLTYPLFFSLLSLPVSLCLSLHRENRNDYYRKWWAACLRRTHKQLIKLKRIISDLFSIFFTKLERILIIRQIATCFQFYFSSP